MIYRRDRQGERDLATDPQVLAGMLPFAKQGANVARSEAPRGTGAYQRSLGAVRTEQGAAITTTDPFWHLIEFGSINNPAYSPLTLAARQIGRFEPNET